MSLDTFFTKDYSVGCDSRKQSGVHNSTTTQANLKRKSVHFSSSSSESSDSSDNTTSSSDDDITYVSSSAASARLKNSAQLKNSDQLNKTENKSNTRVISFKQVRSSAFIGIGQDFLRHPYKKRFLPLSRIIQPTTQNESAGEQDFQYRIDPAHCEFCKQRLYPLLLDPCKNYNVIVVFALSSYVPHGCPQRSNEQSTIGMLAVKIISEEYPEGQNRFYSPSPVLINSDKKTYTESFDHFGHVLEHAATIFAESKLFELLRHTSIYITDVSSLKVPFDTSQLHQPSCEQDPLIPQPFRKWFQEYMNTECAKYRVSSSSSSSFPNIQPAIASTSSILPKEKADEKKVDPLSQVNKQNTNTNPIIKREESEIEKIKKPKEEKEKEKEIIASLNPLKEPWPTPPTFDSKCVDWESEPTVPDKELTNWTFSPTIHTVEYQHKLWKEGREKLYQEKKKKGPSFLSKLDLADDENI
jgi:hypothetical protein